MEIEITAVLSLLNSLKKETDRGVIGGVVLNLHLQ